MHAFNRKPLARYPEPQYPELHAHNDTPTSAIGAVKRIVAAAMVTISSGAAFYGCDIIEPPLGGVPAWDHCFVSDVKAGELVKAEFEARGYNITEDHELGDDDTTFFADGYDSEAQVGYEYQAYQEGDYLDASAEELIWSWSENDGPFFLLLEEKQYDCEYDEGEAEALEELRSEVESFFDSLSDQGAL